MNRAVDLLADRRLGRERIVFPVMEPVPHLEGQPAVDAGLEADVGRWVLGEVGPIFEFFSKAFDEAVDHDAIGNLRGQREHSRRVTRPIDDGSGVDQRVRRDHLLAITGSERGGAHLDVFDDASVVVDRDFIAQAEWALQQHEEASNEILQDVLKRQAEGEGQEAKAAKHQGWAAEPASEEGDHAQHDDCQVRNPGYEEGNLLVDVRALQLISYRASNHARDDEAEQEKQDALDESGPRVLPVRDYPVPHGAHSRDACGSALGRSFALGAFRGNVSFADDGHLGGGGSGRGFLDLFAMRRDLDDQVFGLIEELASRRHLQVFDPDLVVDLLQAGNIDGDDRWQVGRQAFHFEGVQPALQVGFTLGDQLNFAFDLDGHLRLDLLGKVHLVEIHVEQIAVAGVALHLADQRLSNRFVAQLKVDKLVATDLLKGLDELAPVHQHRHGVDIVAVYDGGEATLATQRLEMAATVGARLELEGDRGSSRQRNSSFGSYWAAPTLTQRLALAEGAFTGTFRQ